MTCLAWMFDSHSRTNENKTIFIDRSVMKFEDRSQFDMIKQSIGWQCFLALLTQLLCAAQKKKNTQTHFFFYLRFSPLFTVCAPTTSKKAKQQETNRRKPRLILYIHRYQINGHRIKIHLLYIQEWRGLQHLPTMDLTQQ